MKRLVDLLRVNESRFTAIILGAMTIAAVINFNGQLGSGGGVPCLYAVSYTHLTLPTILLV